MKGSQTICGVASRSVNENERIMELESKAKLEYLFALFFIRRERFEFETYLNISETTILRKINHDIMAT